MTATTTDDRSRRRSNQVERLEWLVDHPTFRIVEWPSLAAGHPVASSYVETFWLPILGPSALLVGRRLGDWLDETAGETVVDLVDLGASIGIGTGTGRHTSINRTLIRLCDYSLARIEGDHLEVRTVWPDLPPRMHHRLPDSLRTELEHTDEAGR